VADWIVYRKGSFYLKERIASEALFRKRKEALECHGATFVSMVRGNNPWLRRALELPAVGGARASWH
jgi:hypothetical protein